MTDIRIALPASERLRRTSSPRRLLCVFSAVLGNAAFSARLRSALNAIPSVETSCILLNSEDFRRFRAPAWARLSGPLEAQWVGNAKLRQEIQHPFDAIIINGWELAIAAGRLIRHFPTAVAMDAVPALLPELEPPCNTPRRWAKKFAGQVYQRAFARTTKDVDLFLPMSEWCKQALVTHHGIEPDRCWVTRVPQDVEIWSPEPRSRGESLRLLFVGNDFARKGGDLLLRLFRDRLYPHCSLTIVSNDPALAGMDLPVGAQLLHGLAHADMRSIYQASDALVLPTQRDMMPQVIGEALSMGLPCLASDIGAIRELVNDGENGFLLPASATAEDWASRILELAASRETLNQLSEGARQSAERWLGMAAFQRLIATAVDELLPIQHT